jgi:hypothetical protein
MLGRFTVVEQQIERLFPFFAVKASLPLHALKVLQLHFYCFGCQSCFPILNHLRGFFRQNEVITSYKIAHTK